MSPDAGTAWSFGDRLLMPNRPEWGVGSVTRAEPTTVRGDACWSLTVRFPNAGIKTINTSAVQPERVEDQSGEAAQAIAEAAQSAHDELLGPHAKRRVEDLMVNLPEDCRDPFRSIPIRIKASLRLYRFEGSGRSLLDWAVAQTGLDDPLATFNRQELETHYGRWAEARDLHLARLIHEAQQNGESVDSVLSEAPEAALRAVKRARIRL